MSDSDAKPIPKGLTAKAKWAILGVSGMIGGGIADACKDFIKDKIKDYHLLDTIWTWMMSPLWLWSPIRWISVLGAACLCCIGGVWLWRWNQIRRNRHHILLRMTWHGAEWEWQPDGKDGYKPGSAKIICPNPCMHEVVPRMSGEVVTMECDDCGRTFAIGNTKPPRTVEDLLRAADRENDSRMRKWRGGAYGDHWVDVAKDTARSASQSPVASGQKELAHQSKPEAAHVGVGPKPVLPNQNPKMVKADVEAIVREHHKQASIKSAQETEVNSKRWREREEREKAAKIASDAKKHNDLVDQGLREYLAQVIAAKQSSETDQRTAEQEMNRIKTEHALKPLNEDGALRTTTTTNREAATPGSGTHAVEGTVPKVFISYSHDSDTHKQWVATLAGRLRSVGIGVTLDQWDVTLGSDLAFFMEQGPQSAIRVLVICTPTYCDKANAGKGGAGYEKCIVTQDLIRHTQTDRFIPVVRIADGDPTSVIPTCLGGRLFIDMRQGQRDRFDELVRDLHRITAPKPPLGEYPRDPGRSAKAAKHTTSESQAPRLGGNDTGEPRNAKVITAGMTAEQALASIGTNARSPDEVAESIIRLAFNDGENRRYQFVIQGVLPKLDSLALTASERNSGLIFLQDRGYMEGSGKDSSARCWITDAGRAWYAEQKQRRANRDEKRRLNAPFNPSAKVARAVPERPRPSSRDPIIVIAREIIVDDRPHSKRPRTLRCRLRNTSTQDITLLIPEWTPETDALCEGMDPWSAYDDPSVPGETASFLLGAGAECFVLIGLHDRADPDSMRILPDGAAGMIVIPITVGGRMGQAAMLV